MKWRSACLIQDSSLVSVPCSNPMGEMEHAHFFLVGVQEVIWYWTIAQLVRGMPQFVSRMVTFCSLMQAHPMAAIYT